MGLAQQLRSSPVVLEQVYSRAWLCIVKDDSEAPKRCVEAYELLVPLRGVIQYDHTLREREH